MTSTTATRPIPQSVRNLHKIFDPENIVLTIQPQLAGVIGIDKAHIISQIHYWLENPNAGYLAEGMKWIYNGYKEWAKQLPWLSVDQIGCLIRQLEKEELIITDNFNPNPYDRRKWYRLNYQLIKEKTGWNPLGLKTKPPSKSSEKNTEKENNHITEEESNFQKPEESLKPLPQANLQNCRMQSSKLQNAIFKFYIFIYKEYPQITKYFFKEIEKNIVEFTIKEENTAKSEEIVKQDNEEISHFDETELDEKKDLNLDQKDSGNSPKEENNNPTEKEKYNTTTVEKRGEDNTTKKEKEVKVDLPSREKYEWEVAVGRPHADFVRWRANLHYKPQGGHWATGAASHAASEIIKKSESQPEAVRWMWQDFLEYAERSADNALSAEATGSTPSLPSCFEEKEVDQEMVEKKLVRAKVSVEKVNQEQQALKAESQSNPALPSQELTEEEKFWSVLEKKLMWFQATWKSCCDRSDSDFRANLLKELPEQVRSTPGLMMTDEGPMLDPDFVFVPE